jgi:hypothetical protein
MWLRRNILWLILLLIGVYLCYTIVKILNDKNSRLKVVNNISAEYSSPFFQNKMTNPTSYVLYNTDLSPVSDFYYDNDYWVVITKLKTNKSDSLPLVKVVNGKSTLTEGVVYAGFDEGYFHLDFLPDSNQIYSVMVTINGDSIKNISKSNDLVAYTCKCKSVSISYNDFKNNNLSIEHSLNKLVPSCIVFLRRDKSMYLVFLSEADPKTSAKFATFNLNQIFRNQSSVSK